MIDLISLDNNKKVNSAFGYRSASSTNGKGSTNHKGIDLTLANDNIPSVLGGKVIENAWNNARGWYITILQKDGTTARYQHMASKSPLLVGTSVGEGQIIGTQGSTGASTGKHLHFEVLSASGQYIDPEKYLSGATNTETGSTLVDGWGRPVSNEAGTDGADNIEMGSSFSWLWDILGKVITFLVVVLIIIVAVILFMKAFDIKLF